MKLNTIVRLILSMAVALTSSVVLISCGSNPIAPDPIVSIQSITNAAVTAFKPASGATPATNGTGTGSLIIFIQGSSIVLDTDTSTKTNTSTGVTTTFVSPMGLTVFSDPTTGVGSQMIIYSYTNSGTVAPNTLIFDQHTYTYRSKLTGAQGTITGTIQVYYN